MSPIAANFNEIDDIVEGTVTKWFKVCALARLKTISLAFCVKTTLMKKNGLVPIN
ncbi:hypothetical protein GCM10017161_38980 [Thalassotalea marina]|uniref:Uncharacterized protein n=1 Tax=Thalassotalea marina TaxID=1673741 RepID=A0A919BQ13_9GAMM|nr:hypothetical protein GCM10017161_38980 [Thalassotalea marina]